jgi:hypothetical protein
MTRPALSLHGTSWAGLAGGPACWALDTQLNYSLLPWACGAGWSPVPGIAVLLAVLSLGSATSSWLAWRRYGGPGVAVPEQDGHPRQLLAGLGVAAGVLFALGILLQGAAGLLLDPCLR